MRYDKVVTFVSETEGGYNENTGDYEDGMLIRVTKSANVSDLGEEKKALVVGDLSKKAKVVRLNGVFTDSFDWIEYDGDKYVVTLPKFHRRETVFYVGEA